MYSAAHGAEERLEPHFGRGNYAVGDTAQLEQACDALQHFILQELWCVLTGVESSLRLLLT